MKLICFCFALCFLGMHQSFAQPKKLKTNLALFRYHLNVLDSAAAQTKGDTISCCSASIAFLVEQTDVETEAEGTTFGFLFFTREELNKWHKWFNAKAEIEIVDPVANQPFNIERKDMFLKIPDSIRGKKNEGHFLVQIKLDSAGRMMGHELLKLQYIRENLLVCDFRWFPGQKEIEGKGDDLLLSEIVPVIDAYIKNEIKIKRNKNQKASTVNILRFLTRFE